MALTTLASVQNIPGMSVYTASFLQYEITSADRAIKSFLKRDIELAGYTEFFSGAETPDIVLKQYPVQLSGPTQIAVTGATNANPVVVTSANHGLTTGYPVQIQGVGGNTAANGYWPCTVIDANTFSIPVAGNGTYTSSTGTWAQGTTVWVDVGGYGGQSGLSGSYGSGTLMPVGTYMIVLDSGGKSSNRGLLRRIGGNLGSAAGMGWWPEYNYNWGSKLAASKKPSWPMGESNIKVQYTAGYAVVPADLTYACDTLVAWMVRIQPYGGRPLQSEGYENYSYSLAAAENGKIPELGTVLQTLKYYREVSW
jgi:hypothetical protein